MDQRNQETGNWPTKRGDESKTEKKGKERMEDPRTEGEEVEGDRLWGAHA